MENWIQKIQEIATGVATSYGCELYDIEMTGTGSGRTLVVYIDKAEGIGIEDCSNISKGLNNFLDESDLVPGCEYNLEVSSPGLDRKLKTKRHFEQVLGKKAYFQLKQSLASCGLTTGALTNAKKFDAEVSTALEDVVTLKVQDEFVNVPYSNIEKAKLVFEMNNQAKTMKKKK